MTISKITDHVEQGTALLLEQYKNKPRLNAWLTSYLLEVQSLEDAAWDVLILRLLDYATGIQLDGVGEIVGEPRRDHDDETYRRFIRVRIKVNRSKGQSADVLGVLALLDPTPRLFLEMPPANMLFEFTVPATVDAPDILAILRDTKAGGVGLVIIMPTSADKSFVCGDSESLDNDPDRAVGDSENPDDFGLVSDVLA